jgi:ribosomal protein S18 acetylase RimI-like enzyme
VRLLVAHEGCTGIALSVAPDNQIARSLYADLGFVETGETAEDGAERVLRLTISQAQRVIGGDLSSDGIEASG